MARPPAGGARLLLALLFIGLAGSAARDEGGDDMPPVRVALVHYRQTAKVKVDLDPTLEATAVAHVEFCRGCPDPHAEGSQVDGLTAAQGLADYNVMAELAYAVPNDVSREKGLFNKQELVGRVALVHRGNVPLVDKVLRCQSAGAVGVLIVDDGSCAGAGGGELQCGRIGSAKDGGFARKDDWQAWRKVDVPVVLVSELVGGRLRNMMSLERVNIPKFGDQWVAAVPTKRRR